MDFGAIRRLEFKFPSPLKEKRTGKNPAANLQALLGIVILMWAGNNVTRPFRVAGAAALVPVIYKGFKKIQK
ncbi:hypothetical protein SAY86_016572 [Trapa natans]|uniref:Uncharacterized protein n=1 Tax=Trapa natans TaxID=22666 RepID=A0AAN7LJZ9_TRANT|nr:hypothetical protein SAY86_016572 [Trapa natans]